MFPEQKPSLLCVKTGKMLKFTNSSSDSFECFKDDWLIFFERKCWQKLTLADVPTLFKVTLLCDGGGDFKHLDCERASGACFVHHLPAVKFIVTFFSNILGFLPGRAPLLCDADTALQDYHQHSDTTSVCHQAQFYNHTALNSPCYTCLSRQVYLCCFINDTKGTRGGGFYFNPPWEGVLKGWLILAEHQHGGLL